MAGQNVRFANPAIREEAVGCLGIRPILADERNALSHGASNLREQFAESVAEPRVPKLASTTLSINPTFTFQGPQTAFCRSIPYCQPHRAPPRESGAQKGITSDSFDSRFRRSADQPEWSKLWVIESRSAPRLRLIESAAFLVFLA